MIEQDIKITIKARLCGSKYDQESAKENITEVVGDIQNVMGRHCNTIDISAHFDSHGLSVDEDHVVVNIELDRY